MESPLELSFKPRPYQIPLIKALNSGTKRAVFVAHRRAGKDILAFNWAIFQLLLNPGWTAFHILPTYNQAKKVIWDANTNESKRLLDYIPAPYIESKNGQEMKIRFTNGSLYQLIGSDNIDSLVGTNPKIIIFSEYAIQSPAAWDYLRPILDVNKGFALFISTPRGKNHFYDLMCMAKHNADWFCEILSIKETGVLSESDIDKIRSEGVSEELIQQEYYCSFNRGVEGSYYGKLIEKARNENRICNVPYDTRCPVNTAWDIGFGDSTSIVFFQEVGGEIRIIDFYENQGEGIAHYAKKIQEKPYVYGTHYMPHDAGSGSIQTGRTLQDIVYEQGIKTILLEREIDIQIGIEAVRSLLSTAYIDENKCRHLLKCLENYHKKYNEKTESYSENPVHDWCFTGDTKILTRNGVCRIMELPKNGEVLTLCGWKQYIDPRITKINAPLVEVKFADGNTVRCTPEHLFLTVNGWKSAESLIPYTEIRSSLMNSPNTSIVDYIEYGQMKPTSQEEEQNYIEMFGNLHLVKYLQNVTSTIKTAILETIYWKILNACPHPNICQQHGKIFHQENLVIRREKKLLNGIDQKKVGCGINEMQNEQKTGQNGKENHGIVCSVIKNLWRWCVKTVINQNIVMQIAKQPIIESVKQLDYKEDVWCLTVPEQEHFSLSNGAIVHNCSHAADAVRYMANARTQYGRGPGSMTKETVAKLRANAGYGPKPTPLRHQIMNTNPFIGR